jgi:hypothetical protein
VAHKTLLGRIETEGPSMRQFDHGPNIVKRFFKKHKRFARGYTVFNIVFFIFGSSLFGYAAGVFGNPQLNLPSWVPYFLLIYSGYFAYIGYRISEESIRRELLRLLEDKK